MGAMGNIARKYRRALRNKTGVKFTYEELQAYAAAGALAIATHAENEELCPATQAPALSTITGSTSAGTEHRPTSGRSPATRPVLDRSSIAALVNGA